MTDSLDALILFVERHPRLTVLTGAGVSTGSGIPDYRDARGAWKRRAPVQFRDFHAQLRTRQRYWARSLVGWRSFEAARPNLGHHALAALERFGHVGRLITQNVDRLHQAAGAVRVIDLHGRLDRVVCLGCARHTPRATLQHWLMNLNPGFAAWAAESGPDGDADIGEQDCSDFLVPDCPACSGILKPDVVFFGETVPGPRVDAAMQALQASDALLVCGSSLMVYSGYRFCRAAAAAGLPVAAINLGRTRADDLLELKVRVRCEDALPVLAAALQS